MRASPARRLLCQIGIASLCLAFVACTSSSPTTAPTPDRESLTAASVMNQTLGTFIDRLDGIENVAVEADSFTSFYRRTYAAPIPELDVQTVPDGHADWIHWVAASPVHVVTEPMLAARFSSDVDLVASTRRDTLDGRPLHRLTLHLVRMGDDGTEHTETRRVWVDPSIRMARKMTVESGSALSPTASPAKTPVTVTWSGFHREDGWTWPREIQVNVDGEPPKAARVKRVRINEGVPTALFPSDPHTTALNAPPQQVGDSMAVAILQNAVRAHQKQIRRVESFTTWASSFAAHHDYVVRRDLRTTRLEVKSWDESLPPRVRRLAGIDWSDLGELYQFSASAFTWRGTTTLDGHRVHVLHADELSPFGMRAFGPFLRDFTVWVDAETYRPHRISRVALYRLADPSTPVWIREQIDLSDVRTHGGVDVPHRTRVTLEPAPDHNDVPLRRLVRDDEAWIASQPEAFQDGLRQRVADTHALLTRLVDTSRLSYDVRISGVDVRSLPPSDTTFVDSNW